MQLDIHLSKNRILFVSDVHLTPKHPEREARFVHLMDTEATSCDCIVILGDLFEFWFNYHSVFFKEYYPILFLLNNLVKAGKRILYIAGNHDFHLGDFFKDRVGIETSDRALALRIDDHLVYIDHGDLIDSADYGYRVLRTLVRNPLTYRVFQLIHPDLGWKIAQLLSASTKSLHAPTRIVSDVIYSHYLNRRAAEGFSVVIHGHFHSQYQKTYSFQHTSVTALNPGSQITSCNWIIYEHGTFFLKSEELHRNNL